ncbi:MAG: class I SAM-dependent methyltransferase [Prolixibacteraceae bacterium]|nr:class I SAM-dependent methyltransferase [Prolixibacteraceae bacterium]
MENSFDLVAKEWDDKPERKAQIEEIARVLERELQFSPSDLILDYGCGTGLMGFRLIDKVGEVTFCDTSEGMLGQVAQKLENNGSGKGKIVKADYSKTDLAKETFDKIITVKVLHHVEDLMPLLKNFHRSLKPGGWLCCVDLEKEDGSFHDGEHVPHKGFERAVFENWLVDAGFLPQYYSNEIISEKERDGVLKQYRVFVSLARK